MKKVSLKEYAEKYNDQLTRRGHRMSESYIYRLIRQHQGTEKGEKLANPPKGLRKLWFKYEFEGEKDKVLIILPN